MRFFHKKLSKHFVCIFAVAGIFGFLASKIVNDNKYIDQVLKTEDYSYLPSEAKEYIEESYVETGKIMLTEKNKIADAPYLNPNYVVYLGLDEEEKAGVELAPDAYVIDYNPSTTYTIDEPLPATYDLRDVEGLNFTTATKSQGRTGLCWAIAAIENVETLLMYQNQTETVNSFSVRQLDYSTANNNLAAYAEWDECGATCEYESYDNANNANHALGAGGNFFSATIAMANAITLADEAVIPWTEAHTPKKASKILGTDKAIYEVDSSIVLPTINADSVTPTLINEYVEDVKSYILQYGGPFVGTYSPTSTCAFENGDGNTVIKTDSCIRNSENATKGHAMQIIGWDDAYTYAYCDDGTKHLAAINSATCTAGDLTTGQGAWLLRNSWGNSYQYIYLTYDSTRLSIGFVTAVSSMADKTWDNNYHVNPWTNKNVSDGILYTTAQDKTFHTNNTNNEKIEKIKLFVVNQNGNYSISVSSNGAEYNNIASLNSNEAGIYTIDLSDQNVIVGETFTISVVGNNNSYFFKDTMSIFTSNINQNEYAVAYSDEAYDKNLPLSNSNPLYVIGSKTNWDFSLNLYLKNIPETDSLTYQIRKGERTASHFGTAKISIVPETTSATFRHSNSSSDFVYGNEIGTTWIFEIVHQGNVVASFPIVFNTALDPSLEISSQTGAIILAYGTDFSSLSSKISTRANNGVGHFDQNGAILNINTLKTGDSIKVDTYEMNNQEFKIVIRGDVDGNGEIGIIDYIRIKKDIMDTAKLNGIYAEAADMNQNNSIDIIDYIRIRKIIMEAQ